jgi:hypothetical protein
MKKPGKIPRSKTAPTCLYTHVFPKGNAQDTVKKVYGVSEVKGEGYKPS